MPWTIIGIVVVVALLIAAWTYIPPQRPPLNWLIPVVLLVIAAVVVARLTGLA